MLRNVASKVAWVGKTACVVFGLDLVPEGCGYGFRRQRPAFYPRPEQCGHRVDQAHWQRPAMQVQNTNDTALILSVESGEAPMRVNFSGKVVNLNADKLDGKEPSQIKDARAYALVDPTKVRAELPFCSATRLRDVSHDGQFPVKTERTILSSGTSTDTEANDEGFVIVVP